MGSVGAGTSDFWSAPFLFHPFDMPTYARASDASARSD